MTPGGDDLVLQGRTTSDLRLLQPLFRAHWPHAVFELDEIGGVDELFVYETLDGLLAWKKDGATPENETAHPMVNVILGEKSVTFVVHGRDTPTGKMVFEVRKRLADARGTLRAPKPVLRVLLHHANPFELCVLLKECGIDAEVVQLDKNQGHLSDLHVREAGTNMWFIIGNDGAVYRVPGEEP